MSTDYEVGELNILKPNPGFSCLQLKSDWVLDRRIEKQGKRGNGGSEGVVVRNKVLKEFSMPSCSMGVEHTRARFLFAVGNPTY